MDHSAVEQYFELALDLPTGKREALLRRLDADEPELARELRGMLTRLVRNDDFACRPGQGGEPRAEPRGQDEVAPELDHLHHVAVPVDDIARACAWYSDVFACEVEYQDSSWAQIRFGNVRLALVLAEQHPPHFAVARDDARKFGPLQLHRDGSRSIYIVDPWNNSVEILERRSLPASQAP